MNEITKREELTKKYEASRIKAEAVEAVGKKLLGLIENAHNEMAWNNEQVDKRRDEGKPSTYFEEQADKEWQIILILDKIEQSFREQHAV